MPKPRKLKLASINIAFAAAMLAATSRGAIVFGMMCLVISQVCEAFTVLAASIKVRDFKLITRER